MRPRLLSAERDFDPQQPAPAHTEDLVQDLELSTLWEAMARGDKELRSVARAVMLRAFTDPADIVYRQQVLADCLRNSSAVRTLYELAHQALTAEQKFLRGGAAGLTRAVRALDALSGFLRQLRKLAEGHAGRFHSPGFTRLFQAIRSELDDGYLRTVHRILEQLQFDHGIVVSARLGDGNKGVDFVVHEPPGPNSYRALRKSRLKFSVTGQAEHEYQALGRLRLRALAQIADAAAQSADHVRDFFRALRDELGFYLGCANLAQTLAELGVPTCWPEPHQPAEQALSAQQLSEPCLALRLRHGVVGSDLDATGRDLVVITGPNQGGKSTFLRSLGLAHVMMQAGMFVAAKQFAASTVTGVFTYYKREEDASMVSGKLAEELARMSAIADQVRPGALVLCNESFASTNDREGSDIAAEIVQALADTGIRVAFVTHLYEFASQLRARSPDRCLFLRADRGPHGDRAFTLSPGEPSPTAYGADLYTSIFGTAPTRDHPPRP